MPEVTIPDRLDFSQAEINRMAKRKELANGKYRFKIVQAERTINEKSGNFSIVTQCSALRDPEDANSETKPYARNQLTLPKANPDVPGHKAPNTGGLMNSFFRALYPEDIPERPERGDDGNWYFKGEAIERDQYEPCMQEIYAAVSEKMSAAWADPATLIGHVFYAEYGPDKTGQYKNIQNPSSELPDGWELTPADKFFDDADEAESEEAPAKPAASKSNGKAAAKKPAGKKK